MKTNSERTGEAAVAGAAPCSAISCAATNPDQWITLYGNGRLRIHTRNLDTTSKRPYRTFDYRPKLKSDREAIRRLIWHLNLVAAGHEGMECQVRDCFSPNDSSSVTDTRNARQTKTL